MIDMCRCIFRVILPLLNVVVVAAATKEATTASGATISSSLVIVAAVLCHQCGRVATCVAPMQMGIVMISQGQWHHNIMARPSRHIL
jgi:hypothetical protein